MALNLCYVVSRRVKKTLYLVLGGRGVSVATFGRTDILTDVAEITRDNVCDVLVSALTTHQKNAAQIQYLYNYYLGDQPVLQRQPEVRPEINNPIVENNAYEVVEFKVGYFCYEPTQYVSAVDSKEVTAAIDKLNRYMRMVDKSAQDRAIVWWFYIGGVGYRIVLPNPYYKPDDAPFEMYDLDPRTTFVVKYNGLGKKPVMNVTFVMREDGVVVFSVYTRDWYYEIEDGIKIVREEPNPLGELPIIEYPANQAQLGSFEMVISLMDALNETESNRADAVENFVQALLLFHNVDISAKDFDELRKKGALKFKDIDANLQAEIKYLVEELDQGETQVFVDHLYQRILTICGMPNRNGGSSTSDTGKAVIFRDGWSMAEYRAKHTEGFFRSSEMAALKVALHICRVLGAIDLDVSTVDVRCARRNYENIKEKADVLVEMLNNDSIDPKLAFMHSGMFLDPETAYQLSMKYKKEHAEEELAQLERIAGIKKKTAGSEGNTDDV